VVNDADPLMDNGIINRAAQGVVTGLVFGMAWAIVETIRHWLGK